MGSESPRRSVMGVWSPDEEPPDLSWAPSLSSEASYYMLLTRFSISGAPSQRQPVCWAQPLRRVRLFAALWAVARQAPLSMTLPGSNPGVSCHFPLQGIFLTQGSNPHISYISCVGKQVLSLQPHLGSPKTSREESRF